MRDIDTSLKRYFPDPRGFRVLLKRVGGVLIGDMVSEYRCSQERKTGGSRICFPSDGDDPDMNHALSIELTREYLLSMGAVKDTEYDIISNDGTETLRRCGCYRAGGNVILDFFKLNGHLIELSHQRWHICVDDLALEACSIKAPISILTYYGSYVLRAQSLSRNVDGRDTWRPSTKKMFEFNRKSPRLALEYVGLWNSIELQEYHQDLTAEWDRT
jgi:hypothetical protein